MCVCLVDWTPMLCALFTLHRLLHPLAMVCQLPIVAGNSGNSVALALRFATLFLLGLLFLPLV
jgi:hypothetical protein